jgi:hypothetical protein
MTRNLIVIIVVALIHLAPHLIQWLAPAASPIEPPPPRYYLMGLPA